MLCAAVWTSCEHLCRGDRWCGGKKKRPGMLSAGPLNCNRSELAGWYLFKGPHDRDRSEVIVECVGADDTAAHTAFADAAVGDTMDDNIM